LTSTERQRAAVRATRRRSELRRADDYRRLALAVEARRDLASREVGRAWLNGRELGGEDDRYAHLAVSHD
jgi:hypothetical protein